MLINVCMYLTVQLRIYIFHITADLGDHAMSIVCWCNSTIPYRIVIKYYKRYFLRRSSWNIQLSLIRATYYMPWFVLCDTKKIHLPDVTTRNLNHIRWYFFLFYIQSLIFFNHTRCEPLWALELYFDIPYWRLVDRQSV